MTTYPQRPLVHLLLTNDDGIDSIGLQLLARRLKPYGDVTIVAPDREFSGSGASIGSIYLEEPTVKKVDVEGIEKAWTVAGPPGLCVLYARMGAFGPVPDLVVAGINPGANVSKAIYHSGTIGAALTARNGDISGIAISQAVTVDNATQTWPEILQNQKWEVAAEVAAAATESVISNPPEKASVLNINVPNLPLAKIKGCEWTNVGTTQNRSLSTVELVPDGEVYKVKMNWGKTLKAEVGTDTAALANGFISASWLSTIDSAPISSPRLETSLTQLLN